ncbi:MAG: hypothetical protein ACYTG5_02895 [Planctomycetota bacterium]|jgi:hypothetical protein
MPKALEPFLERDFLAYEKHRQKDAEYNALRLSVRRKLKSLVDEAKRRAKDEGIELSAQAGLHHPYSFNSFRVREQRAYLCRSNKERKKLASFFGEALGKDAETHYIQTVLEACLDDQVLEAALRIHPQAWWDGEHLKKQVASDEGMAEWCRLLKTLPAGYGLRMHDWRKIYWASSANPQEMREYFASYTPGEHWLHLVRELPKEDALEMGEEAGEWLITSLLALLPIYKIMLWAP